MPGSIRRGSAERGRLMLSCAQTPMTERSSPKLQWWMAVCSLSMALMGLASCSDGSPLCYAGEYRSCSCDGDFGYQQCDGVAFGACDCDNAPPGLGGGPPANGSGGAVGSGGAGGMSPLPFLSPCDTNEQCETGLCFQFNAKGPHCSMPCENDEQCPPPSPGCNNMGVCKVP